MSKLFHYRENQNLTQDELAEKSGVSVRTIQRIEAGANLKGHTLKVLASALEIDQKDLIDKKKDAHDEEAYNFPLIKLINLSSLLFLIPFCNILAPLLIMHFKNERNAITKQIVSVQIMWMIVSVAFFLITPFVQKWLSLPRELILVVLMLSFLVNIFIILRNTKELDKKQQLRIKLNYSII